MTGSAAVAEVMQAIATHSVVNFFIKRFNSLFGNRWIVIRVENIAKKQLSVGKSPAYIARYAIEFISRTIEQMSIGIRETCGDLPFVYAGGVMSDGIIRDRLTSQYDCLFAKPEFSCDNAAGIAVLASLKDRS